MSFARTQVRLGNGINELGRGADDVDSLLLDKIENDVSVREKRRAVIQRQRSPAGQSGYQPVPHHPAAGREIKKPIIGAQSHVQLLLLKVLQQRPASTVDNTLGHTRGS